jgi:hypothetical protein
MLRPTYSFNELRKLLRLSDSRHELEVIRFLIRTDEKRYTLYEYQYLRDLWVVQAARAGAL